MAVDARRGLLLLGVVLALALTLHGALSPSEPHVVHSSTATAEAVQAAPGAAEEHSLHGSGHEMLHAFRMRLAAAYGLVLYLLAALLASRLPGQALESMSGGRSSAALLEVFDPSRSTLLRHGVLLRV